MTLDRQEALARARSVVVKVGSAVLTTPEGLNLPVLRDLVISCTVWPEPGGG